MTTPLSRRARGLLIGFHILFAATWLAGIGALLALSLASSKATGGESLAAIRQTMRTVDAALIIPSCLGSLLTGALISWKTPWGFFRHVWVLLKWAGTVGLILLGASLLDPWVRATANLAEHHGAAAITDPEYVALCARIEAFGVGQWVVLIALLFLSTLKPFGKLYPRAPRPAADR